MGFIFAVAMFILEVSITRERKSGAGRIKNKRGRVIKCYKPWEEKNPPPLKRQPGNDIGGLLRALPPTCGPVPS